MLYPLLAMVAMVFLLLGVGFLRRYRAVQRQEMTLGYFRLLSGEAPTYVQQATRHYSNLFEMPVLFYVVAVICILYPVEGPWITALGWGYVAARIAHAYIHLTYNNVIHRALAFQVGNTFLIVLWLIVAFNLAG